jgi:hypothetical protein
MRAQKFTKEDMETLKGMGRGLLKERSVNARLNIETLHQFSC